MLRRHRRFWIVLTSALLLAPLTVGILAPDGDLAAVEWRVGAPFPEFPRAVADWLGFTRRLDAYLRDHFGLRHAMIRGHATLVHRWLASGNGHVLVGRDGWLFFRPAAMLQQSAGLRVRTTRLAETANVLASVRAALAARGTRLIVSFPPNSATIYPEFLPQWAQNPARRTEYDVMLDALAARGVEAVDLRPPLRAAKREGAIYFAHDTHWTARGALAGFNAIAAAAGREGWRLDPGQALGPPVRQGGGDLARMLGLSEDLSEEAQWLTLPTGREELSVPPPPQAEHKFPTVSLASNLAAGLSVMVIGDSFTYGLFPALALAHASRVIFTPHQHCGFDWKWIEKFNPDEVWWMPTERVFLCKEGARPKGMPAIEIAQPGPSIKVGSAPAP